MQEALRVADLVKAASRASQESEGERPEAFMAPIERAFADVGDAIRRDVAKDLTRLLGEPLEKAFGERGGVTGEQIEYLKLLVRQHYLAHLAPDARAAFWAVPQKIRDRWVEMGILGPSGTHSPYPAIDDAVVAARVAELLAHGTSYARMVQMATERPLSRIEELAREIARDHAGYAIWRLADRHGDLALGLGDVARQGEFGALLADYMTGRLHWDDRPVRGNQALASALRKKFTVRGGDIERDWLRVAVSETRFAFNYATFVHYLEEDYREVYYVVQPDACAYCKRLLLNEDGTPKIFQLDDIVEDLAANGGLNVGRSAAKIGHEGGWKPTALIHPWCRCRPVPHIRGLPTMPVGDLREGRRGPHERGRA